MFLFWKVQAIQMDDHLVNFGTKKIKVESAFNFTGAHKSVLISGFHWMTLLLSMIISPSFCMRWHSPYSVWKETANEYFSKTNVPHEFHCMFPNVFFLFYKSLLKFNFLVLRCFTSRFLRTGECTYTYFGKIDSNIWTVRNLLTFSLILI